MTLPVLGTRVVLMFTNIAMCTSMVTAPLKHSSVGVIVRILVTDLILDE